MVLTFQNPILVLVLALKTSIFLSVASFWLPPLSYIRVSSDDSRSPSHPVASISSVAVSVTGVFLRNRIVSPVSSPNLEDQWIALRQASTLRPVSRQHSSRDHWPRQGGDPSVAPLPKYSTKSLDTKYRQSNIFSTNFFKTAENWIKWS